MDGESSGRDFWRAGAIASAGLAVALAVVGFALQGPPRAPQDLVYGALQLFVLESDQLGDPPYNWWLEVARFLAPATTAYAVFETLRALLGGEIRRRRTARLRRHAIVCGDDDASLLLAGAIREGGRRVVLVGRRPAPGRRDVDVVRGDPRDAATLRAAGVGAAAVLYACAPTGDTNAAVVLTAAGLGARRATRLDAFAHVADDDLVDALRAAQLSAPRAGRAAADFFALDGTAARAVLAGSGLTGAGGPVVIVGDAPFGRALLRALLRGPGAGGARWDVRVHTREPAAVAELAEQLGAAARGFTVTTAGLGDPVADPSERVFVCLPGEEATIGLAARLARVPGRRVVACLRRAAPFAGALAGTERLQVVGVLDEACRPERIEADAMIHRAARGIHEWYVAQRRAEGATEATNPSMRDWADLPAHLRESNYAQAEHIPVKLRAIGATVTTLPPHPPFAFRDGEVERLAELEHERWVDERRAAGFVPGPVRVGRHHPDLVPWPELSAVARGKDVEAVEYLPALLESVGLFLVRTGAASRPAGGAQPARDHQ